MCTHTYIKDIISTCCNGLAVGRKGLNLDLRDFWSQSSQGGRGEGVSRLGEWMGLKSVLTCEGAHLPYGQAMRSWLPQDTYQLAACRGCSCQGSPPRPRVPTHLRTRLAERNPMRTSADATTWVPNDLSSKTWVTRRSPGLSRGISGSRTLGDI